MSKIVSIFILILVLSNFTISYYTSKNDYENKFISSGQSESSLKLQINMAISFPNKQYTYALLTPLLEKYEGNIFFDNVTVDKNGTKIYSKYVYLTYLGYEDFFELEYGRFFDKNDIKSNKYISTKDFEDELQIGKILSFGDSSIFYIKPLYSLVQESIPFGGKFTIIFPNSEKANSFLEEFNDKSIFSAEYKDNNIQEAYSFPLQIIINFEYYILIILIIFDIFKSSRKISIKKMLGYGTIDIVSGVLAKYVLFYLVFAIFVPVLGTLFIFKDWNSLTVSFLKNLMLSELIQVFVLIVILIIPYVFISKIKLVYLLKYINKNSKSFLLNQFSKIIITSIYIILFSLSYNSFEKNHLKYNTNFKYWEDTKNYYVLPSLGNISNDELTSVNFRTKQKNLYAKFNSEGSVLADFASYQHRFDKDFAVRKPYVRNAMVNPNYLVKHDVFDINDNKIFVDEMNENFIIMISEKYKDSEDEIIEYYEFIKKGTSKEVEMQKIDIIWVKDGQKLFSYDIDINIDESNMVNLDFVRILTLKNGALTDYDRIMGYTGNPFKILDKENIDPLQYIMSNLAEEELENYFVDTVCVYSMIETELLTNKNMLVYQLMALFTALIFMITLIIQNIYIFHKNNIDKISVLKLIGSSFISKYFQYYIILIVNWIVVLLIIRQLDLFYNTNSIYILSVMSFIELIISFVYFTILEKASIIKFLRGEN